MHDSGTGIRYAPGHLFGQHIRIVWDQGFWLNWKMVRPKQLLFLFWSFSRFGGLFFPFMGALADDCVPVSITSQPQDRYVLEGCPVTFSVGVAESEPFSYQWFRNNQLIPDATNASYTIVHAQYRDSGSIFRVRV